MGSREKSAVVFLTEAVIRRCSVKKVFLEILQNSQKNTCARVSFLIKLQTSACNFIKKETLAQVFSCEFCKISKNSFSYRTSPVAAFLSYEKFPFFFSFQRALYYFIDIIFFRRTDAVAWGCSVKKVS